MVGALSEDKEAGSKRRRREEEGEGDGERLGFSPPGLKVTSLSTPLLASCSGDMRVEVEEAVEREEAKGSSLALLVLRLKDKEEGGARLLPEFLPLLFLLLVLSLSWV